MLQLRADEKTARCEYAFAVAGMAQRRTQAVTALQGMSSAAVVCCKTAPARSNSTRPS